MKELVVISGKGGTGKTSIVGSFAALAEGAMLADCDVDAADLHLLLQPTVRMREPFVGGKIAEIDPARCTGCGQCAEACVFGAIAPDDNADEATYRVKRLLCEGCGVCARACPEQAVDLQPRTCGEWFVSDTRYGPMTHAKLGIAEENSGRLVTLVRQQAKFEAVERGLDLLLVDGPPGIGCPVIASITGADLLLAITEPTCSGLHDLGRVGDLAKHFGVPMLICINKCDLNDELARQIEAKAEQWNSEVIGRIHYDKAVTQAMVAGQSIIEYGQSTAADEIRELWRTVSERLDRIEHRPSTVPEQSQTT